MNTKQKLIMGLVLLTSTQNLLADVYLNGYYIKPYEIPMLEALGVGNGNLTSGRYWINFNTGLWGYGDYYDPSASTTSLTSQYYEDRVAESIASMGYSIPTPSTAFTPGSSFTYDY